MQTKYDSPAPEIQRLGVSSQWVHGVHMLGVSIIDLKNLCIKSIKMGSAGSRDLCNGNFSYDSRKLYTRSIKTSSRGSRSLYVRSCMPNSGSIITVYVPWLFSSETVRWYFNLHLSALGDHNILIGLVASGSRVFNLLHHVHPLYNFAEYNVLVV